MAFSEAYIERRGLALYPVGADQVAAAERVAILYISRENRAEEIGARIENLIALEHHVRRGRKAHHNGMRRIRDLGFQKRSGAEELIGPEAGHHVRHWKTEPLNGEGRSVSKGDQSA